MKTQLSAKLVCLLAIALLAPLAQASLLGVGGTAPPTPITPTGPTLAFTSGTITALSFTADYSTWVVSDPLNTFCVNCLDFVYVFTNNGPAPNQRYSMSSFSGFNIDAGTNPFGFHDPNTVSRSVLLNGDVISFNFDQFGNDIVAGETTVQLVIETDALHFTTGILSAQDGSAGSGYGFQPSAVPEPSSLALMGGGLSVFGLLLRKFRL
jgi:PEP-CTERM motif